MPTDSCQAEFDHTCDENGFSMSMDHGNVWYCKKAYSIFLAAKNQVQEEMRQQLQRAIDSQAARAAKLSGGGGSK